MTHPPHDYYICPSCGTEFENDDFETSHAELRRRWLQNGARWFSRATPPPPNWNPYRQLINIGVMEYADSAEGTATKVSYANLTTGVIVSSLNGAVSITGRVYERMGDLVLAACPARA
jgi:hypothetical protein